MELETLSCNNCGAPINIPESANFATCAHCGSRLAVKRTDTAHYTEVIEKLEQRTNRIDEQMQRLQIDNELLRIDRDWEMERQDYMVSTKGGGKVVPTLGNAIAGVVGGVILVIMTCVVLVPWSSTGSGNGSAGGLFFLFALIGGGFAIFAAVDGFMKYQAYQEAEANYYARRASVESRRSSSSTGTLWRGDSETRSFIE